MSGHSKWSNIKHKKASQDTKRGKIFTQLIREITMAVHQGGPDSNMNPRLRIAISNALNKNMKKDGIERAIQRVMGSEKNVALEEVRYEGYGPLGIAFIVDCITNNRNRSIAEIRHAFSQLGINLGNTGSVCYMFRQKGIISFEADSNEGKIMEVALEAGAKDVVVNSDKSISVITDSNQFIEIKKAFERQSFDILSAQITLESDIKVPVIEDVLAEKVLRVIHSLKDLKDAHQVYSNAYFGSQKYK